MRLLRGFGVTIEAAPWQLAAEVKAPGGIALGDAHAVALAVTEDATLVVGTDPEFDELPVDVEMHRIRDDAA